MNQFGSEIYSDEISLEDAKNKQHNMSILINKLKVYDPTNTEKIKSRQKVLDNANKFYNIRNDIINVFENKNFFRQSDIGNIAKDFSGQTDEQKSEKNRHYK